MKATKAQPAAVASDDIGWREFPTFQEILAGTEPAPVLAKVEKTCRQLNELLQSGSDADKTRASLAMTAYGRSLDLLRVLTEARDKAANQQ